MSHAARKLHLEGVSGSSNAGSSLQWRDDRRWFLEGLRRGLPFWATAPTRYVSLQLGVLSRSRTRR
jgi:hypothetical protein